MLKVKRGRLWFIRCIYPIPKPPPDQDAVAAQYNAMKSGVPLSKVPQGVRPTMRPIRQPLYDTAELKPVKAGGKLLFHTSGAPGQPGYYSLTQNATEVVWVQHQDHAAGFDTRAEAEERAFELTLIAPWLIAKLEVVKLKTRRLA